MLSNNNQQSWWSRVIWKPMQTKQITALLHKLSHSSNYSCEPVVKRYTQHLVPKIKRSVCFCVSRKKKKSKKKPTKRLRAISFLALPWAHITMTKIKLRTEEQCMSFAQSRLWWGMSMLQRLLRKPPRHSLRTDTSPQYLLPQGRVLQITSVHQKHFFHFSISIQST